MGKSVKMSQLRVASGDISTKCKSDIAWDFGKMDIKHDKAKEISINSQL